MRRGLVIAGVLLLVLAVVGIGAGAYHAGEVHRATEQIVTTTAEGGEVVRVVPTGGWGWHGGFGFFPFGFLVFPLFIVGTVLLVRALLWRGGPGRGGPWAGWGPGGPGGYGGYGGYGGWGGPPRDHGGPGDPRAEWLRRAEEWHRHQHEDEPRPDAEEGPAPAAKL